MVGTISGVLLAMLMNNGGGAWDNAKKWIETGQYGGKKSDAHKAAVVGDTVGDPFKDTAGPSLHVLIKLLATITLVLLLLFVIPKGICFSASSERSTHQSNASPKARCFINCAPTLARTLVWRWWAAM
jgi:hypothetical protein